MTSYVQKLLLDLLIALIIPVAISLILNQSWPIAVGVIAGIATIAYRNYKGGAS